MRRALALAGALLLAGCSGAPKKADPPSPPPGAAGAATRAPTPGARKVSPYAPAQEDPRTRGDYVAGGLYKPGVSDSTPTYIPDVDAIPEPDVVDEPRSRYGNRSPYQVLGASYTVRDSALGHVEEGLASYYGNKFHGRRTSNQEVYDMYAFTAAHKSLPLPSFARVTNLENGRSVVVRVNDRGPFHAGRVVDLSYAAAVKIGVHPRGTARVEVRGLTPDGADRGGTLLAAAAAPPTVSAAAPRPSTANVLPPGVRIATGRPQRMPPSAIDTLVEALPIATVAAAERAPGAVAAPSDSPRPFVPSTVSGTPVTPAPAGEWRFDMVQDGRAMSADEFDAWMKARRARVATGKAGIPDTYGAAAPSASPMPAPETLVAAREADAAPAATPATLPAVAPGGVMLQVAAFGGRDNAERALGMLERAGIDGARLLDGAASGKPIWRLRIGPVAAAGVADLTARIAGLGFGAPHVVRD